MNIDLKAPRGDAVRPRATSLPVLCCVPLEADGLGEHEAQATAALFKALADPHRVRIMNLLARKREAVCVCDITNEIGVSQPTVSFHLKKLVGAGLLLREQRGIWAFYSVAEDALERLGTVFSTKGARS